MSTGENSLRSRLAWASGSGDIVVPEKGRFSEAGALDRAATVSGFI
jgi:hypothetical protein